VHANDDARGYLAAFFRGQAFEGGLRFRAELDKLKLDYTRESLRRLDGLLAWIRLTQPLPRAAFEQEADARQFLYLVTFYLGETVSRLADATVMWWSRRRLCELDAAWQEMESGLHTDLFCFYNQTSSRRAGARLLPITTLLARLCGPDTSRSVLADAEKVIAHLRRQVPGLEADQAARWQALSPAEREALMPDRPDWMNAHYSRFTFDHYEELFARGRVIWGRIVQANNALFRPGADDCAAEVLFDPAGTLSHVELAAPANHLFSLKGTLPRDPTQRRIAHHLTEEFIWASGQEVPASVSATPLRMSTFLVHRQHLPEGRLVFPFFPLLLHPHQPGIVAVLPSRWWPAELLARWHFDAAPRQPAHA
jgi:hypothetical protein